MQSNVIVVYTLETCLQCIQLKAWLKKNSIRIIQKDIKLQSNLDELNALGHNTVPLIKINNVTTNETQIIDGFNKSALIKVLNLNKN